MDKTALSVGVRLKEVATRQTVYSNCTVMHADAVGLAFETQRTVAEGGTVETVICQLFIPWHSIEYILVMEERT